jgi:hypothetical protein
MNNLLICSDPSALNQLQATLWFGFVLVAVVFIALLINDNLRAGREWVEKHKRDREN